MKANGTGTAGLLDVSLIAHRQGTSQAIELLFEPSVLNERLVAGTNLFPLTNSVLQMPESVRRHPRYHEWWARPGYAELAEIRRANGKPEGLPLPIDL